MPLQELPELTDKALNVKGGVGHDYKGGAKTGEPFTPQTPDPDRHPNLRGSHSQTNPSQY